jgi:peptidoglycan/xylan/chitin deacetylase (PgdA/CDA1 family)
MLSSVGSINGAQHSIHSVAMTFDDGPDASVTPRLLDLLARRGARATFFVLTDKATAQPGLTRRIIDEGHEVALHFDRHDRLTCLPLSVARQRLIAARQSLEQLAGKVTYFRPPFGSQTLATYVLARSLGLQVVAWGPYAEDWVEQEPAAAAERALHDLKGGDILLMHDGLETPVGDPLPTFDRVKMVELVLDGMQARGLAAMTVGGLLTTGKARRTAWFRH